MQKLDEIQLLLATKIPLIVIETHDESRVEKEFTRLAIDFERRFYKWSIASGLVNCVNPLDARFIEQPPAKVFADLITQSVPGIYIFYDIHPFMEDPVTVRLIREVCQHEKLGHTLVFVCPEIEIPSELRAVSARFEYQLPSDNIIRTIINEECTRWGSLKKKNVKSNASILSTVVQNLRGLPEIDVRRLVRNIIYDDGLINKIDIRALSKHKHALLDRHSVLTLETETARFSDIAGLAKLKQWCQKRKKIFLDDNPPVGLTPSKGMLLLGVQGGGKSLAAKSIAGSWGIPLLRLDFSSLYNKYYGESEKNLLTALKAAETMAPCVLWVDEIEKSLAGDSDDAGPSRRILGSLLTWMSERDKPVFIVATANDIESMPPELLRKGRFDEIFFIDLPPEEVRSDIFALHLNKREQAAKSFDLCQLAKNSDGFSGAEIEQAIISALYNAHDEGIPLVTKHLLTELQMTRPLSVLMKEKIESLREWALDRTVSAH